jgi:hypothetical protein
MRRTPREEDRARVARSQVGRRESAPPEDRDDGGDGHEAEEDPDLPQALERGDHHAEQEQTADYLEDDAHGARTLATATDQATKERRPAEAGRLRGTGRRDMYVFFM